MNEAEMNLESYIRNVPDFPKKGIVFKDITPLLADPQALRQAAEDLALPFADAGVELVVGIESRGFIFGSMVASILGAGFVPVRKPGKLPYKTVRQTYSLEYGVDTIEMHEDAVPRGSKVLMIDDLLATGGTMQAACELVTKMGGQIAGVAFVIELAFLNGRAKLPGLNIHSLITVAGE